MSEREDRYPWYEVVPSDAPIAQGDMICDCPVMEMSANHDGIPPTEEGFVSLSAVAVRQDVVVMTQACDLEQDKVRNAILCPHYDLDEHRIAWESAMEKKGDNPTPKAWSRYREEIRIGRVQNLSMLNRGPQGESSMGHRIVDFHEIFSVPRSFLEHWLHHYNTDARLRLLPPYREHLSQAFARFFMRVGLPVDVDRDW